MPWLVQVILLTWIQLPHCLQEHHVDGTWSTCAREYRKQPRWLRDLLHQNSPHPQTHRRRTPFPFGGGHLTLYLLLSPKRNFIREIKMAKYRAYVIIVRDRKYIFACAQLMIVFVKFTCFEFLIYFSLLNTDCLGFWYNKEVNNSHSILSK